MMQTAANLSEARALIRDIDRAIDANRAELRSRCVRKPIGWRSWGRAWDRNPDLKLRDDNLFWLRGEFQIQRDRFESQRSLASARKHRSRRVNCPTCGTISLAD